MATRSSRTWHVGGLTTLGAFIVVGLAACGGNPSVTPVAAHSPIAPGRTAAPAAAHKQAASHTSATALPSNLLGQMKSIGCTASQFDIVEADATSSPPKAFAFTTTGAPLTALPTGVWVDPNGGEGMTNILHVPAGTKGELFGLDGGTEAVVQPPEDLIDQAVSNVVFGSNVTQGFACVPSTVPVNPGCTAGQVINEVVSVTDPSGNPGVEVGTYAVMDSGVGQVRDTISPFNAPILTFNTAGQFTFFTATGAQNLVPGSATVLIGSAPSHPITHATVSSVASTGWPTGSLFFCQEDQGGI